MVKWPAAKCVQVRVLNNNIYIVTTIFNNNTTMRNATHSTPGYGEAEPMSLSPQRNATQLDATQRNATHSTQRYGEAKPMSVYFSFCDSAAGLSADICA